MDFQLIYWLVAILTLAISVLVLFWHRQTRRQPPGPWGVPVLGYLPFLGRKMNIAFTNLAKKYGDVFQLSMGSRKVIVINGQKAIRKALLDSGTTFAGRPDFYTYRTNIGWWFKTYSPAYRLYKKQTLKALGEFTSLRRAELQNVAQNAVVMLVDKLKTFENQPVDPKLTLYRVTSTILGYICYGRFFDVDDKDMKDMLEKSDEWADHAVFGLIVDFFPWTKFLVQKRLDKFEQFLRNIAVISDKLADARARTSDDEINRDMTDIFNKMAEGMSDSEKKLLKVDEKTLKEHVLSMFGAGFASISFTLQYGLMIMALNAGIQRKAQDELDRVVGRERYPEFKDESSLPYTSACIVELYRHFSVAALAMNHTTTCDTEFEGYFIANDTPVIINIFSAHRDEEIFKDPEMFDPERFLNEDGSLNKTAVEFVIPYGLGLRRCGGESVARLEVFLFFASILQQCTVEESPEYPLDVNDYIMTFAITHSPIKLVFRSRNGDW